MKSLIYIISIITLLLLLIFGDHKVMDKNELLITLSSSIFSIFISFVFQSKTKILNNNFFKPSVFALLGLIIVNLQIYLDYYVGLTDQYNNFIWINNNVVVYSAYLSAIGINCYLLGLSFNYKLKDKMNKVKYLPNKILSFALIISIILFYVTVEKLYLAGGYGLIDMGASAIYFSLAIDLFFYAYVVSIINNTNLNKKNNQTITFKNYFKSYNIVVIVFLVIYLIGVLTSGDRGPIISIFVTFTFGYYYLNKFKLHIGRTVLYVFLGANFINFLGNVREVDKKFSFSDKVSTVLYGKNEKDKSVLPATYELASSIRTLHYAVDYVPNKHDFFYGRFTIQEFINAIPFVSIFYPLIFPDFEYKNASTANLFTWIEQGDKPTSGVGSSVFAEFYVEFGVLGVLIGGIIFGMLMKYLDVLMYVKSSNSLFELTMLIVYTSVAIYISRSDLFSHLRTIVWVFLILIINQLLFSKRKA